MKEPSFRLKGFTLIELIAVIVLVGFFAALMATVIGTTVAEAPRPMLDTKNTYELRQVIENITVDYLNVASEEEEPLCELCSRIAAGGPSGGSYGTYHATTDFVTYDSSGNISTLGVACSACSSCSNCDVLRVTVQPSSTETSPKFSVLFTNKQ